MKITKEKILFIGIVLLGLVLRLLFIDKQSGFWHNEMVMYNQAIADFPFGIIKSSVEADVHFPFYQLLLAIWMKIFSNTDVVIRLFSVFMGTLTIVFAFLAGKEIKDEKLGNIFALLVAINATFIFYSQEVKFYIMLALLSSMSIFFVARMNKKNDMVSCVGYVLSNVAIVYTFTIGIFYVFAQFVSFLSYAFLKNKKIVKSFLASNIALFLLIVPFIIYVFLNFDKYESASWIFTSNFFTLFVLIQNYFSPVLIAVYNNPVIYIPTISLLPIIFIYIPVSIAFYGIYRAIKLDKNNLFILLIPVIFLLCEVVLTYNSGLRMLTRYTILAILPLLLLAAIGLSSFKSKALKFVITYLLIMNIFFLIAFPQSAVRGYRDIGEKPTAELLMKNGISDNDTIILALRKNDFDKYLDFKGRKFSMLQDFVYKDFAFDKTKSDKYEAFRAYIFDKNFVINRGYENYFLNTVIKPMKKGDKIFLIWDENYNSYPITNSKTYRKYPIMTMSLSKTNADTLKLCKKYLKFNKGFQLKVYKVYIFEKN